MVINIVTINLNNASGLQGTIDSVLTQTDPPDRFHVVDGGSSDGSVTILSSLARDGFTYTSKPDNGISDAFNRGIEAIQSGHILLLNSGDSLVDKSTLSRVRAAEQDGDEDRVLVGGVVLIRPNGEVARTAGPPASLASQRLRNHLPHQAMLIPRSKYGELGDYDGRFRLAMDYEWSLRLLKQSPASYRPLPFVIASMDTEGLSMARYVDTFREDHLARKKNRVMPGVVSWLISRFFMLRRFIATRIDPSRR